MLKRRTWGRGIYTQYTYTAGGKPAMVNYSDTTPDVTYAYDRMGRVTTITDGIGIRSIAFNDLGQPLSEDFTAGILDPVKIENTYDTMGRRTQNTLLVNTQQRNAVAFGYEDLTGRLSTVTKNTTRRARYAYTSGAPGQVQAVIHERFASNAWQATDTGTRVYDGFERLTSIGWTTGTGNNQATVASFAYLYNTANERTRTTLADGSYWQYVYDDLGQVSSGKRYSSTGVPIPGQQFEYTFDDIGNRTQAKAGGDASGNNLRTANYTSNLLNMYTGRGSPGSVDIMGYAPMASYPVSITTGGSTVPVDFRLLEYYQKKVSWTNSAGARFEQVLVESDPTHAGSEKELWVFLPKDPEAFTHDVDGNLLQDGRWNYGWDGENRLIWMESRTDLPTAMPRQRVEFGYDFMSRRNVKRMYIPVAVAEIPGGPLGEPETIGATTSVIDGATASVAGPGSDAAAETLPAWAVSAPVGWSQVGLSKYVWDGWNLLAELDITDASVRTFAWGLDLSGSEQGAGGIGGLVLGWTRANGSLGGEVNGTGGNTLRYVFDGNGNVMAALDDLGRVRAKYEYGPFGETLTSEGDLAADNPIRWSTKYTDGESGLVYYGYRYYNAGTGRWLNRDPIGEKGGVAILAFSTNGPTNRIDVLGLSQPEVGHLDPPVYFDVGSGEWGSQTPDWSGALLHSKISWFTFGAEVVGYPDAAEHLYHYLDNDGSTLTIRADRMVRESKEASDAYRTERNLFTSFVSKFDVGSYDVTSKTAEVAYNQSDKNWFLAVGGFSYWGKGHLDVSCNADGSRHYRFIFVFKVRDRYNWDQGKTVWGLPADDVLGSLHKQGYAREFDVHGQVQELIEWDSSSLPGIPRNMPKNPNPANSSQGDRRGW